MSLQNQIKKINLITENKIKELGSISGFFDYFKDKNFTRLELMILDSSIKKISLDKLYNTLLIPQSRYENVLKQIIVKLKKF